MHSQVGRKKDGERTGCAFLVLVSMSAGRDAHLGTGITCAVLRKSGVLVLWICRCCRGTHRHGDSHSSHRVNICLVGWLHCSALHHSTHATMGRNVNKSSWLCSIKLYLRKAGRGLEGTHYKPWFAKVLWRVICVSWSA